MQHPVHSISAICYTIDIDALLQVIHIIQTIIFPSGNTCIMYCQSICFPEKIKYIIVIYLTQMLRDNGIRSKFCEALTKK